MKLPVYIYAEIQQWNDGAIVYKPCWFKDGDSNHLGVLVCETEIDIPESNRADIINGTVKIMRVEQQKLRAECEVQVENIEQQIGELLAIEDTREAE